MNRRGFLGSIVGATLAGPSAVKTAAATTAGSVQGRIARDALATFSGVLGGNIANGLGSNGAAHLLKMIRGQDYESLAQRANLVRQSVEPLRSVSVAAKDLIAQRRSHEHRIANAVREFAERHPVVFATVVSEDQLVALLEKMAGEDN